MCAMMFVNAKKHPELVEELEALERDYRDVVEYLRASNPMEACEFWRPDHDGDWDCAESPDCSICYYEPQMPELDAMLELRLKEYSFRVAGVQEKLGGDCLVVED